MKKVNLVRLEFIYKLYEDLINMEYEDVTAQTEAFSIHILPLIARMIVEFPGLLAYAKHLEHRLDEVTLTQKGVPHE